MAESPTPFARLIQTYMWKTREPPITAARFAGEIGINRQTVLNWLKGSKPAADMLPLVAEKIGASLADVYRAAGYPVPAELQKRQDIMAYLMEQAERDSNLTVKERHHIIESLREWQAQYEAGEAGDAPDPKVSSLAR